MNVMHDGNHGSYSNKSWVNKFMGGFIYVLAGKCTQLASTTHATSYLHKYSGLMKILMQEELYALQKMQNGITFVSNNITPCFIYGLRFGL
jgi:fatty acid desaturase